MVKVKAYPGRAPLVHLYHRTLSHLKKLLTDIGINPFDRFADDFCSF
jgi:hypothetical protein